MIDLKQIAGTLKYGNFDGTKRKYLILVYVIFTALLYAGLIGLLSAIIIDQVNNNAMPQGDFIAAIIGSVFGFSVLPVILLVLIVKNEKERNEIKLWLNDAVELGAYCETLLQDFTDAPLNQALSLPTSVKIRVKFKYNGKHISRDSGFKDKNGNFKNDYQSVWINYADRSIRILYSPKYDEIIILKNDSHEQ